MTHSTKTKPADRPMGVLAFFDRHSWIWLLLGAAFLVVSQMRFGIGAVAWIAPVPFLRYLRRNSGWRSRIALAGVSLCAWVLATAKIITFPLPLAFAVLFALPVGCVLTVPYLVVPGIRARLGERAAVLAFGAMMVSGEWLLHAVLPFGTWGSAANTQLEQLALLQLASVTGIHGVSFVVYVVASSLESLLHAPSPGRFRLVGGVAAVVLGVVALGEARLVASTARGADRVRVAMVGTDSNIGTGPLPTENERAAVEVGLVDRTRAAARSGASLVVWTEAAALVPPEEEDKFLKRIGAVAHQQGVTVVAGYIVPLSLKPLRYRNRYALLTPQGTVGHVYDKHHPVPGEPAAPSTAPTPIYENAVLGRISGALCYDYDFPRLGLKHARDDVDLVALPSSDWRGIDPIHTQMATLRAIEGGHSVARSTRYGLSAGIDPYGRIRGWLSHWDQGDRVLVVSLPRHGVWTIYGALGDWFPMLCVLTSLISAVAAARSKSRQVFWYHRRPWSTPSSPSPPAPSSSPVSASASRPSHS